MWALPSCRYTLRVLAGVLLAARLSVLLPLSALFLVSSGFFAPLARADSAFAPQDLSAYLTDHAMRDYVLNCAGCHRLDGRGAEQAGVPDFRERVGVFTRLPQGREYLFRVPGAAQALLSDERLAQVLNWIIATYDSQEVRQPGYVPFSGEEVAVARAQRYDDVAKARRDLARKLQALGLEAAPYTYGARNHP